MPDDKIIESAEIEDDDFEEQLSSNIANLSASLSSLSEVDSGLLSKGRQGKLSRMKRLIFDALAYYCDCLPQLMEDGEDEDS